MKRHVSVGAVVAGLLLAVGASSGAQAQSAEELFAARCKSCHDPAVARAPNRTQMGGLPNQQIVEALTTGIMKPMAEGLTPAQIVSLATYLTGRSMTAAEGAGLSAGTAAAAQADVKADPTSPRLSKLGPVSAAMLKAPAAGDWLHWGGAYDGGNYSPLATINRGNVAGLKPAWRAPMQRGPSMPMPLVHDGVMFLQTTPDTVIALDAATGAVLWRRAYKPRGPSSQKMGLALSGGRVFVPTSDLHVQALDARTGELVWDQDIKPSPPATSKGPFNLRSAPLIVGDKLIQGVTGSGAPGGNFIVGLDLATGKEVWRFHTIARPGEPGGETWNGLPLEKRSGGSVWHQGTYDPTLNLVYFGIGQTYDTGPLMKPSGVPGTSLEALYTDSTVALDPNTGKLVWYFQHMPNDQWDLDWAFERQLLTVNVGGKPRRVVVNIGKMGILDALDAKTGAYLFSIDPGTQNVISAIDPKTGAKTIDPTRWPDKTKQTLICPSASGARSWPTSGVNPKTGLLYVPLTQWCLEFGKPTGQGFALLSSGVSLTGADHPDAARSGKMGLIQAMDLKGRKLAWRQELTAPIATSVLATAGGVLFAGDTDPALTALDDRTGKQLWRAPLDGYPSSNVITYAVGGTQYVAVVTGMTNYHINALGRGYRDFRRARGTTTEAPKGEPAIVVFALSKGR